MKRKKLLIISHTEHYKSNDRIVGWGATVNEINYLADYWEEVVHVACLYSSQPPKSSLPYTKENITFVPISPYGGKGFFKKMGILFKMPKIIYTVQSQLKGASEVQLRTPTAMGLFLLPLFTWVWRRNFLFWVKFAGDWEQERPPRSNGWQRWFLQQNWINFPVTINGSWPNQQAHCFSFENPCLTKERLHEGRLNAMSRSFKPPYSFIFVGRIDEVKGVDKILIGLSKQPQELIRDIVIIGDGPKRVNCEKLAVQLNLKVRFLGYLESEQVHEHLKHADFILLPSTNEGFPKVIAEAACYGVIPIVSNVSSLKHYLNEENSFLWDIKGKSTFDEVLTKALNNKEKKFIAISSKVISLAELFTFEHYLLKLNKFVFNTKHLI
jgi:glycosyltransferase involved in cell wall biosynthesis